VKGVGKRTSLTGATVTPCGTTFPPTKFVSQLVSLRVK
jgi:hypothetical protein